MGRASDIEAFARMLDGAPANSVPSSVAALSRTVSALHAIPAPALPASLGGAGGLALLAKPGLGGTRIAATHAAGTNGTRIAATHTATHAASAAASSAAAKVVTTKAGLLGLVTTHLAPVVAGTALLAVGVTGLAVGASRSLPGDPLYGLKRATESVQAAATTTKVDAAEQQLDFATTRLREALALQQRGGSSAALAAEVREWLADETAAMKVLTPLANTPAVRARLTSFAATNATALAQFPAATVATATAAVGSVTALLTPTLAKLPVRVPKLGTTFKLPVVPFIPGAPSLPAAVASTAPKHAPAVTPTKPHLPVTVKTEPVAKASLPAANTPSAPTRPSAPTTLPSVVLPSPTLPTALPTALLTQLPSVSPSDITTLLRNLPKH